VLDLSDGGARIAGVTEVANQVKGSIPSGTWAPLPFTAMHADIGVVHVVFWLEDAGVRRLRSLLERFTNEWAL
jgi:hypothetical protein